MSLYLYLYLSLSLSFYLYLYLYLSLSLYLYRYFYFYLSFSLSLYLSLSLSLSRSLSLYLYLSRSSLTNEHPFILYSNIYFQHILLKWSLINIFFKSYSKAGDILFICWLKITSSFSRRLMSLAIDLSSKGQNPYNISYITTPKLQMSAFIVYIYPFNTYGAM